MSSLARDAAAFKSSLQRQDFTTWHSNPQNATPDSTQASSPPPEPSQKKKKQKSNIVYSQPADTGTGTNVNTQLVYAVDHLKQQGNPMRLQDLAIITNTPLDTNATLLERFRAHDRVIHDPKTDLYSYRHDFTFRTKQQLLTEIQRHTRKGGGLSVRSLKDSWKEAPAAIEELEKDGDVLVTRTAKDGQMRMVFWNELKPEEGNGGMPVEQEFQEVWHKLKVPPDADLLRSLANEGLQATAAETPVPKAPVGRKKGRKQAPRQRQAKLTNAHLRGDIDLSSSGPFGK
ncbi:transcription initiation factor IIE subunit beta [Rickenella mellea]|uniref:Transcription initiation factor IIE subunit beta n=1 Tax=Rickenella mellea TaxID=50990 RepID=A0A4Y7QIX7_9AGAM|nr:transcription initiation factor IIE subunit beta [Rickenella mellea]